MAAGTWLVMILFSLVTMLAFLFLLWASRKGHEEEIKQWKKEVEEWEKQHPVWAFLYMLPFPFWRIFFFFGPKPPSLSDVTNSQVEEENTEQNHGYSPKNSIIE